MSERLLRIYIIGMSTLAHLAAFLQFRFQVRVFSLSYSYNYQMKGIAFLSNNSEILSIWLFAFSYILAILISYCPNQRWLWLFLSARGAILLIVGRLLGDYFGVELILLAALIIEACFYLPFLKGISFSLGLTLLMVLLHSLSFFGLNMPSFTWYEHLTFIVFAALIITITALLKFQRENQVSVTELNRRLNEATLELAQTNMKLQEYAISAEQEAMLNERKRVAREVHDSLAYTLTNLVMMMEAAIDLSAKNSPKLVSHLELARDQANEGLNEVRRALNALRPVQLTDLNGLAAISRLVKAFEKASQIKVELELGNAPLNFGAEANLTVFRLVQEGMTNALRHGRATLISVSLALVENGLSVTIRDNGIGSEKIGPVTGYGLMGMEERLERLGGKLETFSAPGEGFTLSAWIPIQEE